MALVPALDLRPVAHSAPPPVHHIVDDLVGLLESGLVGQRLSAELWRRFPHVSRADVFTAIAITVSLAEADRVGLLHDLHFAEARIAELVAEIASLKTAREA